MWKGRGLNKNRRAVSRYDGWWLWILGDAAAVIGFVGLLGGIEGWTGFPSQTAIPMVDWAVVILVGVLLIIFGAIIDKPAVAKYEHSG